MVRVEDGTGGASVEHRAVSCTRDLERLNFVGLHVPLTARTAIEPGLLNQTVFATGRNQTHHVAAPFAVVRL
jgi:hypothetical protein